MRHARDGALTGSHKFVERRLAAARAFDNLTGDALSNRMSFTVDRIFADTFQREIHPRKRARIKCFIDHACLPHNQIEDKE